MRPLLPLAFITLAAASPAPAQTPQTIEVHLVNFKFTPPTIALVHGQGYSLRLVNDSGNGHSFGARDFFAAADVATQDRGLITNGVVEVPGGESRTIRFTAPAAGSYKLKCTHTLHGAMGMRGQIIVR